MAQTVRAGDLACRYGGEEFALILPNVPSLIAVKVAERVRTAFAGLQLAPRGEAVTITASFGVAEMREVGAQAPAERIAAADAALYQAKQTGRDRVIVQPAAEPGIRPFAAASAA